MGSVLRDPGCDGSEFHRSFFCLALLFQRAAGAGGGELGMADDGDASDKNMMKAFGVMMGIAKMAGILNFSQIKEDDVSMGTLTEYATVFELESLRG